MNIGNNGIGFFGDIIILEQMELNHSLLILPYI